MRLITNYDDTLKHIIFYYHQIKIVDKKRKLELHTHHFT